MTNPEAEGELHPIVAVVLVIVHVLTVAVGVENAQLVRLVLEVKVVVDGSVTTK